VLINNFKNRYISPLKTA